MTAAERVRLIERYANGPALLRAALALVPAAALRWAPAPGEWSAHEVVCHCADAELNAAARIRYLLAEQDPLLVGYNQEAWARTLDYLKQPLDPALATVEAVRASTTALIRDLPDAAWSRRGRHTESGAYTADGWLQIYAEHLEAHARQIEAAATAWSAAQPRGSARS